MRSSALNQRLRLLPAFAAMVVVCAALTAAPAPLQESGPGPGFAEIEQTALGLAAGYGLDRVLLVFDMDNTLLRMNQGLGSDEWYRWQNSLKPGDPDKIGDLNAAQGLLFDLAAMRPTDGPDEARIVKSLQDRGFTIMVLTGRNPAYRSATERELAANGLDFSKSGVPPREGFGGAFLPYDPRNTEAAGFVLPVDRTPEKFPDPRPVSYQNGVMMAFGQNKGWMLRALLNRCGRQYAAILFVDDTPANLENMAGAFEGTSVKVAAVPYTRGGAAFDPAAAAAAWRKLTATVMELFGREFK